ncbi:MAG: glutathione S-transferase N-terminal domain-containing protein [Nanoarchaeota archaeon]
MFRLFVKTMCPYCDVVKAKLAEFGLEEGKDFKILNISESEEAMNTLIEVGGKRQVPFLVDDDRHMYESADIVAYIEKKIAK